jgi:Ca2+-binding RTX toxin-like protein
MLSSRLLRSIVPATLILVLTSAVFALAATNTVSPSSAGNDSYAATANDLKPPECDALDLTTIVINGNGTQSNDLILGTAGSDTLQGKKGDDCIVGGDGDDHLLGGQDNDILLGGPGDDRLDGGKDYDECYGQDGNDTIDGKDCEVSD